MLLVLRGYNPSSPIPAENPLFLENRRLLKNTKLAWPFLNTVYDNHKNCNAMMELVITSLYRDVIM